MAKQKKELPIEWDINERERFKELVLDIKKRSENLANRIKNEVKDNLNHVRQNPYLFQADLLKINNDDSFRTFSVIHIKIIYKIDSDKIIIARVRHASSEPTEY